MSRRPPRSTRTDHLFPVTTLVRSSSSRSKPSSTATRRPTASWRQCSKSLHRARPLGRGIVNGDFAADDGVLGGLGRFLHRRRDERLIVPVQHPVEPALGEAQHLDAWFPSALARRREVVRPAERRGGKECVRTCRYRWSAYH